MKKTCHYNPRSGDTCRVSQHLSPEERLISRREMLMIEDHGEEMLFIEEDAPVRKVVAVEEPRKKKGWFGWWAAALLALLAVGAVIYFATRSRDGATGKPAYAYNVNSNTNEDAAAKRKVIVLRKITVQKNGQNAAANAATAKSATAANLAGINTAASAYANIPTVAINSGSNAYVNAPIASKAAVDAAAASDRTVDYLYYFGNDKSAVADNVILDEIAAQAKAADADITITAHASNTGTTAYNMELSEDRAENLADYLIAHGVKADNIHIEAAGATDQFGSAPLCRRADILVDYAG